MSPLAELRFAVDVQTAAQAAWDAAPDHAEGLWLEACNWDVCEIFGKHAPTLIGLAEAAQSYLHPDNDDRPNYVRLAVLRDALDALKEAQS